MITYHTLLYDHKILYRSSLGLDKYNNLFNNIKKQLGFNKIIYEKYPSKIDKDILVKRDRLITESNDKLLIFAIGNPNVISLLWYKIHNKQKHISIFNGKCVVLNEPIGMHEIEIKHCNQNLFSAVFCDFKYYNIQRFMEHNDTKANFNSNYIIT